MSSSLAPLPTLDQPQSIAPNELDSVRLKLVQLIDAIQLLLSQVHYLAQTVPTPSTQHPGLLSYSELISRYNLILSHVAALSGLLSSIGDPREAERRYRAGEKRRDPRAEKWKGSLVVPAVKVDPAKDWIVGTLLRTKQTLEVEQHLEMLLKGLPQIFMDASTRVQAIEQHESLIKHAVDRIAVLKEGEEGQEWDWQGRVEVEDEDEPVDGDRMQVDPKGGRKWTLQEVATFQRTGKMPA